MIGIEVRSSVGDGADSVTRDGWNSGVGRGDGTRLSSCVGRKGTGVGTKIGNDFGTSVGIGVRAGDGIGFRSDFKSGVDVGACNRTAVVWVGVGGVSITGPGNCNPQPRQNASFLYYHQNQEKFFHIEKRLRVSVEYIL